MRDFLKQPIALIITIFILLFIYSKFGPRIPISVITQQKGEPLIVGEVGKVTAVPDIARINFGIEESGVSLKSVQDSVNQKSKNLVKELKKLGIEEKDIKTSAYNLYPDYDYEVKPVKITGYRVSTNYDIKVRNFDKVNEVLLKGTEAGANVVGNVSFELSNEEKDKAVEKARQEAVEKAKEKAKSLAKAAGISLGKIINISESQGYEYPGPIALKSAVGSGGAGVEPDIKPGETEVTVNISISWEIK